MATSPPHPAQRTPRAHTALSCSRHNSSDATHFRSLDRSIRFARTRSQACASHDPVARRGDGAARRFVVRLAHLNHPAFRELLRQAEQEYGFPAASGPIALPCDEDRFLDVLHRVSSSSKAAVSSCLCGPAVRRAGDSRPLLQGMAVEKLVC